MGAGQDLFELENKCAIDSSCQIICGLDEAGRAPLAGPVTASCVYVPDAVQSDDIWQEITDSKKMSLKRKNKAFDYIKSNCFWGIGEASAREIEDINIHHASLLAMRRAFDDMIGKSPDIFAGKSCMALVDGKFIPPNMPCSAQSLIKGDLKSKTIAAASIIAKVSRDRYMGELANDHPHYGWERNAGYPTKEHKQAIMIHGPCPHHRRNFAGVK